MSTIRIDHVGNTLYLVSLRGREWLVHRDTAPTAAFNPYDPNETCVCIAGGEDAATQLEQLSLGLARAISRLRNPSTAAPTGPAISDAELIEMRGAAADDQDPEIVAQCDAALAGDADARARCAQTLADLSDAEVWP